VARGCIVKNGGKCDGKKMHCSKKPHCGKKPHCVKGRIVEKTALWKIEKYAKKIWHAGVNKPTPSFH
jgi:hypothetical protein